MTAEVVRIRIPPWTGSSLLIACWMVPIATALLFGSIVAAARQVSSPWYILGCACFVALALAPVSRRSVVVNITSDAVNVRRGQESVTIPKAEVARILLFPTQFKPWHNPWPPAFVEEGYRTVFGFNGRTTVQFTMKDGSTVELRTTRPKTLVDALAAVGYPVA